MHFIDWVSNSSGIIVTVIFFTVFLGIAIWAYLPSNKKNLEDQGMIPFKGQEKTAKEKDELSGVETTGHNWDGIKELNKPIPRWWLIVFILAIIYAIGYWVLYPAWPVPHGNSRGELHWNEHKDLAKEESEIAAIQEKNLARIHTSTLQQIQDDKDLYEFAKDGGAAVFKQNCIVCHGSNATGGNGFPNLVDDDWLWGGKLEDIYKTIKVGIRSTSPDTRTSQMPSFGRDGILTPAQIQDVAEFVQKLHLGDKAEITPAYTRGKDIYAANCTVCHGKNGDGNQALGAPRHNDDIWLYGNGDMKSIVDSITNAHAGVMPSWEGRLSDDTIKELAIYVHSLGGGQ